MSQVDFARELGRYHGSVQNYETGKAPSPEVLAKYQAIAAKYGCADLAAELPGGLPLPRNILEPVETLIDAALEKGRKPAAGEKPDPVREHWHDMLDQILDSGLTDAVSAAEWMLLATAKRVDLDRRKSPKKAT